MNILFALYGDFTSNSANPLALYARELHLSGHDCAVAVPSGLDTIHLHDNPAFRPILYVDVLAAPNNVFPDGRPADIIHACTPREIVRQFVFAYMAIQPTPLVVYLEDNETWISTRWMRIDEDALDSRSERDISSRLPVGLSHPFRYHSFIGLADAVAVIQGKLAVEVPPWVYCETVMIGVDIKLFSPRPPDATLRRKYGVAENERVIVYHGGLDNFKRPAIETLCQAVGLVNQQGFACRLLRTGPRPLAFLKHYPDEVASAIGDLGVLPRQALPDLLALADVFVQPGQVDPFEDLRLPGKVPEFLAMGRPVIMPDANIAYLFRDGMDAVLLRSGTAEEIAAKCIELFTDPQRARAIGQAGRHVAEKYFDVRLQARRLEVLYQAARDIFNPTIAAETWRNCDENTPVTLPLTRKLRLLAGVQSTRFKCDSRELLKAHADCIESMSRRLHGLEATLDKRTSGVAKIASRAAAVYRRWRGWRKSKPLLLAAHALRKALRLAR